MIPELNQIIKKELDMEQYDLQLHVITDFYQRKNVNGLTPDQQKNSLAFISQKLKTVPGIKKFGPHKNCTIAG